MYGHRDVAADLRRRIEDEEWRQGETLPPIPVFQHEYGVAKLTVRLALADCEDSGHVVLRDRHPALVRSRHPIRVPLSRYGEVLSPGGTMGPWETACHQQGVAGEMRLMSVEREPADEETAAALRLEPGAEVCCRYRHAFANGELLQLQWARYPGEFADRTPIGQKGKIVGGVLGALAGIGVHPSEASEEVEVDDPEPEECHTLSIGSRVKVLRLTRVTWDGDKPMEVVNVVAPADRIKLVYDRLPLSPGS